jgi:S-formylglutathione hydrolase
MIKAGAQRVAAELGLMLVAPDTSPRGEGVPDAEDGAWDLGLGAGFYLDATRRPGRATTACTATWSRTNCRSWSPPLSRRHGSPGHLRPLDGRARCARAGPALPGDLFLGLGFRTDRGTEPLPVGPEGIHGLPGRGSAAWAGVGCHRAGPPRIGDARGRPKILVDQGLDDQFLDDPAVSRPVRGGLREAGQALELRRHAGYDHGYFFIASFIEDHLRHHAAQLEAGVSEADRQRWDARYAAGPGDGPGAQAARAGTRDRLPRRGRALDIACGEGQLAGSGWRSAASR